MTKTKRANGIVEIDTHIKLPKSPLWRTAHQNKSPYLRVLMDSFFEFLQDEIDEFGYSLYNVGIYGTQKILVVYGYDPDDGEPTKELSDADIRIYWEEFLDNHIAEQGDGSYEAAAEVSIVNYRYKIASIKKSIKQHKQMMELFRQ